MKKLQGLIPILCIMIFILNGCSKGNIFSWAHKSGGNSDIRALEADAYTALKDGDYIKALEYYSKILESDPSNSEAIYGYSIATLANAGLDIGSIVANLVKQQAAAPSHLAPAISGIVRSSPSTNILPDTILNNIPTMQAAIDDILSSNHLPKIVKGNADGKISPDNPDINLNIALCLVLRAAIRVNNIIKYGTDYESITIENTANLDTLSRQSAMDLVSAYHRIEIVIDKLNLDNDDSISNILSDIESLFNSLKSLLKTSYGIDFNDSPQVSLSFDYL